MGSRQKYRAGGSQGVLAPFIKTATETFALF